MHTLLANAGTPLMWLLASHLLVGNLLLGIAEAALLHYAWKAPWKRAIPWMVIGNYVSAGVGALLAGALETLAAGPPDPRRALLVIGVGAATFLGVTIVVEAPFVALACERRLRPNRRAWLASLGVQLASYAILVPFYLDASALTFATRARLIQASELRVVPGLWIYYQDLATGDVWRMALDGGSRERMAAAPPDPNATLVALDEGTLTVQPGGPELWRMPVDGVPVLRNGHFSTAADLSGGRFVVTAGFWAAQGLSIRDTVAGTERRFALETPFVSWSVGDASVLPNGWVVCRVRDTVVLLDPWEEQFAVLADGYAPVLVIGSE